jgi:hypothetical protein
MVSKNEHTGAEIKTKHASNKYRDNFDKIFKQGKKAMNEWDDLVNKENVLIKDIPEDQHETLAVFMVGRQVPTFDSIYKFDYMQFLDTRK